MTPEEAGKKMGIPKGVGERGGSNNEIPLMMGHVITAPEIK